MVKTNPLNHNWLDFAILLELALHQFQKKLLIRYGMSQADSARVNSKNTLCDEGPCILLNYYQSTVPCCRPSFTDDKLNATSCLDEWQMHENVLQGRRNQRVLVGYPWTS